MKNPENRERRYQGPSALTVLFLIMFSIVVHMYSSVSIADHRVSGAWAALGQDKNNSDNNSNSLVASILSRVSDSGIRERITTASTKELNEVQNESTPLMTSIELGQDGIASLLIEKGADVNLKTSNSTPLILAISKQNTAIVEKLLAYGANPNAPDAMGSVPLHFAQSKDSARLLIDHGASMSARDHYGNTPLMTALISGNQDVAQFLIKSGSDVFTRNYLGITTLHVAAKGGSAELVNALLKMKLGESNDNDFGSTALHMAGSKDVAAVLIAHGFHVDSLDAFQSTPLHSAILTDVPEVAEVLLERNANPTLKTIEGLTPLEMAVGLGQIDVVKKLVEKGAPVTAPIIEDASLLHLARTKEMAEYLLGMGVDIKRKDIRGVTPLISLLKHHADDIEDKDLDAVQSEAIPVVEVLIEAGVDINANDETLMSAIDYASMAGMDKVVAMLAAKGAKVSDINEKMLHSALQNASTSKTLEIHCNGEDYVRWDVDTKLVYDWIAKGLLNEIKQLEIRDCVLEKLPSNIGSLKNLKRLEIRRSQLKGLDYIDQISNLSYLNLTGNQIEIIPESLQRLPRLTTLVLAENKIRHIPAGLIKQFRTQMVDMDLSQNPIENPIALFSTDPAATLEMKRFLNPKNPLYKKNLEAVLHNPRADVSVFVKTPGKNVEKILEDILRKHAAILMQEHNVQGHKYRPAAKLLAAKLLENLRHRQHLAFLQSDNTSIGRVLGEQTLPQRSKENLAKLDHLLGPMTKKEKILYHQIIKMPFYLKHYTPASRYKAIEETDSELKSFKTLNIQHSQTMHRGNTSEADRVLGNTGNVFFRLETSPELTSTSRFGASVITMDEEMLYRKGWVYFWDLLASASERTKYYPEFNPRRIVGRIEKQLDPDLGADAVKDHKIRIDYIHPKNGASDPDNFEFSIADTFFYGEDIKPGLAKFMVYEIRRMGLVSEVVNNPGRIKTIYRRLYSVQAMIPGEVKLNPTNSKFIKERSLKSVNKSE